MATLYCLEDYVHLEEEKLGCTERQQMWNHSKKHKVEPCPTDDVRSCKTVYGKEKHSNLQHVNNWDCRLSTRRIIQTKKNATRKLVYYIYI